MTKTILITGANRGLGLALSEQYRADGWNVLATCRNPQGADALKDLGLEPLELDVTDEASLTALRQKLDGESIDILFSNAGVFGPRGLELGELDSKVWLEVLNINTVAPAMLAQAFVQNVAASQEKLMVFMSSSMGSITDTSGGEYIYRSSKAALNMVAASLAQDLRSQGIRSVAMRPGWVSTDMGGDEAPLSPKVSASGVKTTLDNLSATETGVFLSHDRSSVDW